MYLKIFKVNIVRDDRTFFSLGPGAYDFGKINTYPGYMYIRGISVTIVNCTKAVKLIYSFII